MLRKIVKNSFILAALSGGLITAAFPDANIWILAWIGFVPLFLALDGLNLKKVFLVSYLAGLVFYFGTVYWLIHVTLPGLIAVGLYIALYFGVFGLAVSLAVARIPSMYGIVLFIPSVWVCLEYIRSYLFGGLGWALLGHSQASVLPIIQIADITGVYGVSFVIVLVNATLYIAIKKFRKPDYPYECVAISLICVFLLLGYGSYRLNNVFLGDKLKVAVIQGNIPQKAKWDYQFRQDIINKYIRLTRMAAKDNPDLIIWPETAVPGFIDTETDLKDAVSAVAKEASSPMLVGSPRETASGAYFNSAFLFMPDGSIAGRYDKVHLVPFGEYIPFKKIFSFVEKFTKSTIGDFSSGGEYTVLQFFMKRSAKTNEGNWKLIKRVRLGCLICFEDIFPDISRRFVNNGAGFLVNITNDAWFGNTSAPYQHAQSSIFRAVENRVNVVRAANTGYSCFIDQKGRVTKAVSSGGKDLFVEGYALQEIVLSRIKTWYGQYGDMFAYICFFFTCLSIFGYGIILTGRRD